MKWEKKKKERRKAPLSQTEMKPDTHVYSIDSLEDIALVTNWNKKVQSGQNSSSTEPGLAWGSWLWLWGWEAFFAPSVFCAGVSMFWPHSKWLVLTLKPQEYSLPRKIQSLMRESLLLVFLKNDCVAGKRRKGRQMSGARKPTKWLCPLSHGAQGPRGWRGEAEHAGKSAWEGETDGVGGTAPPPLGLSCLETY